MTPTYPDPSSPDLREFQASSPDEIALVKFADLLSMRLLDRDTSRILLLNPVGTREEYQILALFPFSSESKRMGIVVRHVLSGKVIFYLKGAEQVVKAKVRPGQRVTIDESCEMLANEGLRTLVVC